MFFAVFYPKAKIIAVEPNLDNFELLKLNTKFINIECIHAAIGPEDGFAHLGDPGLSDWGFRLVEEGGVLTAVKGANDLCTLQRNSDLVPFICKIDIEGGEDNLFSKNLDWFELFPAHVIELHDWLMPFKRTSNNLLRHVSSLQYDIIHHGENTFFFHDSLEAYQES